MRRISILGLILLAVAAVYSFGGGLFGGFFGPSTSLAIVSGSENKALEPIIQDWAQAENVEVSVTYLGSVDISRELTKGQATVYDAVWPANSLWITLGDDRKVVKHAQSILRSPVVLGLEKSIAERLGWVGRDDVTIQEIQEAARGGAFRLAMTSATQSNSGASAYFGFLYAMAGDPDILTMAHLDDPAVRDGVRDLLSQVDRSSGSSGWLKDSLVANPGAYDAMMNYEAIILEANQALIAEGRAPLYVVYPANGLSVADSPLGYVSKGDAAKEEAFLALQAHLLQAETQDALVALGRRAGLIGLSADKADQAVWNPAWGVDLARAIAPIPTPEAEVIARALQLYQTELRKPSLTVWVLDVSGSMQGEPLQQLKQAMGLLLDPEAAAVNLLQPSERDVTVIIPFSSRAQNAVIIEGADPARLAEAARAVAGLRSGGGTDLYGALIKAMEMLAPFDEADRLSDYLPAIVAMTDGASNTTNEDALRAALNRLPYGRDVPIHTIAFGAADEAQLDALSQATIGRRFNAGSDLAAALRKAKGYN